MRILITHWNMFPESLKSLAQKEQVFRITLKTAMTCWQCIFPICSELPHRSELPPINVKYAHMICRNENITSKCCCVYHVYWYLYCRFYISLKNLILKQNCHLFRIWWGNFEHSVTTLDLHESTSYEVCKVIEQKLNLKNNSFIDLKIVPKKSGVILNALPLNSFFD